MRCEYLYRLNFYRDLHEEDFYHFTPGELVKSVERLVTFTTSGWGWIDVVQDSIVFNEGDFYLGYWSNQPNHRFDQGPAGFEYRARVSPSNLTNLHLRAAGRYTPLSPIPINPPDNSIIDESVVNFSWLNTAGLKGYYTLQIAADSNFTDIYKETMGIKSNRIELAIPDSGLYYWRVKAYDALDFESSFSESAYKFRQIEAPILTELIGLRTEVENNAVILKWDMMNEINIAGFEIYRSDDDGDSILLSQIKIGSQPEGPKGAVDCHEYCYKDESVESNKKYEYKLAVIDLDGHSDFYPPISIFCSFGVMPTRFDLEQNYPNPFNSTTRINYQIPHEAYVYIDICNLKGQKICLLIEKKIVAGFYSLVWNGRDDLGGILGSGIYILRMKANDFSVSRRITLLR